MRTAFIWSALILLLHHGPVLAFPDGAPWDMDMTNGCVLCHFDGEPVIDQTVLHLTGLPEEITAGERYHLTVVLDVPEAAATGMMIAAWLSEPDGSNGKPAGNMESTKDSVEVRGNHARSTQDAHQWHLIWQAPGQPQAGTVSFILWGNAANGDGSPFGDLILVQRERRTITAPAQEKRPDFRP